VGGCARAASRQTRARDALAAERGVHGWPEHACIGCSLATDPVAHLAHLNARDTTLVYAWRAPQVDIARLKVRMGWEIPRYTITDSFEADFGVDECSRFGTRSQHRGGGGEPARRLPDVAAKDAAVSFIGPTCGSSTPHVRNTARTGNRVATVIVGSMGAPAAPTEAEPMPTTVAALEPTQASAGATAKSILTPAQLTVGRSTPAPKKRKTAGVRLAHPDSAGINAYAAVPWSGREDRRHYAAHAAAPQFNYAGPFGGIR
jgi:hypothetical protein